MEGSCIDVNSGDVVRVELDMQLTDEVQVLVPFRSTVGLKAMKFVRKRKHLKSIRIKNEVDIRWTGG